MIGPGQNGFPSRVPPGVGVPTVLELRIFQSQCEEAIREAIPSGRPIGTAYEAELPIGYLSRPEKLGEQMRAILDLLWWECVRFLHAQGMSASDDGAFDEPEIRSIEGRPGAFKIVLRWVHRDAGKRAPWKFREKEPAIATE